MMISIENLRKYCRTCWVKLEMTAEDGAIKAFSTNKHPELENFMKVCLAKTTMVGDDSLGCFSPFLCRCCYEKWLDFLKLYKLAVKTDKSIRAVLEKEAFKMQLSNDNVNLNNIKENKSELNEYFINESLVNINEEEKYETHYPFYAKNLSKPITEIKHNEVPTQLYIDSEVEELDNFEIDNNIKDIGYIPKEAKKQKTTNILNSRRKTKSSKVLCTLKRENQSDTLQKDCQNLTVEKIQNKNTSHSDDIDGKKIPYKCEECNKYFREKIKYDGHRKQIHEGIRRAYQCNKCNKAYNLYKTLAQHKRECHSEKSKEEFKCEKCDKIFKTAVILKQHQNNKHTEQKLSLRSICDKCGFIAAHQYSLSRHIINKHTETDHIKCDYCPKVFKTQYSLKYHVIGNHNASNIKPFKCPECEMGFFRKTLLNQHKRTHLNYTERIKCDFEGCEVRFVKHGDKTHHMRLVHLKIKQHICDFCGDAFGAMQTLRHHRFIHTGEKPYKCNVCGQCFRQRTAMKTHRKTHDGNKFENAGLIENLPEINICLTSSNNVQL